MRQHIVQCKCKLIKDNKTVQGCAKDKLHIGKLNQIIKQEIKCIQVIRVHDIISISMADIDNDKYRLYSTQTIF